MPFQVRLPTSQKSFLCLQQYKIPESQNIYFIITTMDRYLFIVLVQKQNYGILLVDELSSPGTALGYNEQKMVLHVGCASGDVYIQNLKHLSMTKYIQKDTKIRPQVIMVYEKQEFIYVWNLNSQIIKINSKSLQVKEKVFLGKDITCAKASIMPNNSIGYVSFLNNCPPFVFDCTNCGQIVDHFSRSEDIYEKNQQNDCGEIQSIQKLIDKNGHIQLFCSETKQNKSYISIFSIEQEEGIKFCSLHKKILLEVNILKLSVKDNFISISSSQRLTCFSYNSSLLKIVFEIKNNQNILFFQFISSKLYDRKIEYRYFLCKGFSQKLKDSRLQLKNIHVKELFKIQNI